MACLAKFKNLLKDYSTDVLAIATDMKYPKPYHTKNTLNNNITR